MKIRTKPPDHTEEWDGLTDKQCNIIIHMMERLDLHGVLLLAPVCPHCGEPHDYQLISSITPDSVPEALHAVLEALNAGKTIQ